jgi:hypothetical protein
MFHQVFERIFCNQDFEAENQVPSRQVNLSAGAKYAILRASLIGTSEQTGTAVLILDPLPGSA